ncbi:MFS transporter [Neobacillus sp. 114]|uniref:MFS transporter n=1 Tax=Neobacillus sp. 114 TaxID=3048535 RepID=UPI0024C3A9E0|nr:MFS transporter [Neobacillus sp. 114]
MDFNKNVHKLYFIVFFRSLIPAYVIERLFWQERGMTVLMVVFCEIIYAVTIVGLEIPTGILADKFGRKAMLVIGSFLSMLEFIILLFAFNFWTFALVVFLAGISSACRSGSLNALLYDTLKVTNEQESFEKIVGSLNSLDFFGAILAALSGSALAKYYGFELNYILSAASMLIAFGMTVVLREPPSKKLLVDKQTKTVGWREYFVSAIAFFKNKPRLLVVITHAMAISACVKYLDEFWQLYLDEIGFSVIFFGLFSALISLARIPGNLIAAYLKNYFRTETIILYVLGVTACGFIFSAMFPGWLGVAMLIFVFLASGVVEPIVSGYLHHSGSSEIRATIESFQSLIERGITFIVGIGFGLISSNISVIAGFSFLGAVTFIFFLLFFKKYRGKSS